MSDTRVLIVDDNQAYREAFARNLALRGYGVLEAADSLQAVERVQAESPDVVVTDLAMRHPTEGLELIRQVRALRPHLPVIMISAVGTFDEGAEAMRLGAWQVISKSKIDEEMASLYSAIDAAARANLAAAACLGAIAAAAKEAEADKPKALAALNEILRRPDAPQSVKSEAFDRIAELSGEEAPAPKRDLFDSAAKEAIEQVEAALRAEIEGYDALDNDTKQTLKTAEFLYRQSERAQGEVDFSRSMGFTYCFAVENEAKARLRKRLQKFLGDPSTPGIVHSLLEANGKSVSIFFQQHLLRAQQGSESEATIENFFFTFQRILEHRGRYKPDGLKALGIVILCFGRGYSFRKMDKEVKIDNPLGLKGLEGAGEAIKFASLLINLQHYRNPYIHPEISEMTKLSQIRETAFACLNLISKIQ